MVVQNDEELRRAIMTEAHSSLFMAHPGGDKMYHDMRRLYLWVGMKRDIAKFLSRCSTCQLVKVDHQCPTGVL